MSDQSTENNSNDLTFNTLPNQLTIFRMVLVPVVVILMFFEDQRTDLAAAVVFGIASITDYFDGYFARTRKISTIYGKLMDPLADKFLVISALIMLQYIDRIHPVVNIVLICRELGITGLRAIASAEGVIIAASWAAKWKTTAQMIAIPLVIINQRIYQLDLGMVGRILIYFSLAISLWSAKEYIISFFQRTKKKAG